jgi:hypothetical protein
MKRTITLQFSCEDEDDLDIHDIDIEVENTPEYADLRLTICDAVRAAINDHPAVKDHTWCH